MGESFRADDARDLDPPRLRLPRAVRPPVAPIVRPGLIEYPPRPGWPYQPRPGVRRIKLSVSLVVLAVIVLLFIAYQVISGFLGMIDGLVN